MGRNTINLRQEHRDAVTKLRTLTNEDAFLAVQYQYT